MFKRPSTQIAIASFALLLAGCGTSSVPQQNQALLNAQRLALCTDPTDPTCTTPPPPPPVVDKSRYVQLYMNSLYSSQTSDQSGGIGNSRDEVFIQVAADTPSAQYPIRLPRRADNDDYYGFDYMQTASASDVSTWLNRDQAYMGKPLIYSGRLFDGQSVQFVVTLLEQDNGDLGSIRGALSATLNGLSGIQAGGTNAAATNIWIQAGLAAAKGLVSLIPDNKAGDMIGGFTVRITNNGGNIEKLWIPLDKVTVSKGTASTTMDVNSPYAISNSSVTNDIHSFTMNGTSDSKYQATASVETIDASRFYNDKPLQFLGKESDACGSDNLYLNGIQIPRNQTKATRVSLSDGDHWWNRGGYFHWDCDGSSEQTGPDQETNYVIASHHGGIGDRDIQWYTFKTVDR